MPSSAECQALMLTPRGRGAVATIRLQGTAALGVVTQLFRPLSGESLTSLPSASIVVGQWQCKSSSHGERLVICLRAPEQIDVHCHGGWSAAAVLMSLAELGVDQITWEDWLAAHGSDPIASAALVALASACTERTATVLLDQYAGALRREIESICDLLEARDMAAAEARLGELQASGLVGMRLTQPWRVVLCGRPNVGKSSLINAMVGYRRAIVHDRSGTTRDVVTAVTAWQGWPIELADTAGIRETQGAVESAGIERAHREVESSDLVLLVADASHRWDNEDIRLADSLRVDLLIHNKADIGVNCALRPAGWSTIATTGEGIDQLMSGIARHLLSRCPLPGAAVPFTCAQNTAISDALVATQSADRDAATTALTSLLAC